MSAPTRRGMLTRTETGAEGTFGRLVLDDGWACATIELPWRGNARGRSCVPAGTYTFTWQRSPRHGECYEALLDADAPGRTDIQIHAANLAGDADLGYVAQLEGCIAPGQAFALFSGGCPPAGYRDQRGVTASRATTRALEARLARAPLELSIRWAPGVDPRGAA